MFPGTAQRPSALCFQDVRTPNAAPLGSLPPKGRTLTYEVRPTSLATQGTRMVGLVGASSGGLRELQGSDAGRLRDPRVPRIPPTAVLACWALGTLVFAFLPQGSGAKSVIATVFSLSTAAFTAVILLRAAARAEGHERAFLRLMGLAWSAGSQGTRSGARPNTWSLASPRRWPRRTSPTPSHTRCW